MIESKDKLGELCQQLQYEVKEGQLVRLT